jgi:hypothetical protein
LVGKASPEALVPEHHAVLLGVALGQAGVLPARTLAREVEGEAHDPLAAGLTGAAVLTKDVGGTAATDDVTATIIDELEPASAGYGEGDP